MADIVKIVEEKPIPKQPIIITGLPDVGLVGVIAAYEIISYLKMQEIARVESELFPPMVVLHEGLPYAPVRFFGHGNLVTLVSEIALPSLAVAPISEAIVKWAHEKKAELVISIGGVAEQDRQNIKNLDVFGAASDRTSLQILEDHNIKILEEGYLVGAYALILKDCVEKKIPSISLLAQSFYNYPDPEAAAAVLTELNKLLGTNIDTSDLIKRGEEIRLKARDVMKRTEVEMEEMRKTQEYDVPPLYV